MNLDTVVPQHSDHWEHYDHGADIGVRGVAVTKASAFEQAAMALTAVVTEPSSAAPRSQLEVICEGADDEMVFIEWLDALVYEMVTRKMLFSRFEVRLHENGLTGRLWGEKVARLEPMICIKG